MDEIGGFRDAVALAILPTIVKCVLDDPRNHVINGSYLDDIVDGEATGNYMAEAAYRIADAMIECRHAARLDMHKEGEGCRS